MAKLVQLLEIPWGIVTALWIAGAVSAKPNLRIDSRPARRWQVLALVLGFALLFSQRVRVGWLDIQVVPTPVWGTILGLAVTCLGISFAIWARFYLAGNWSAEVAIKNDHELVCSGPYSLVRHPIYAGLFVAMLGTAAAIGDLGCFLGAIFALASWTAKARLEERHLLDRFGATYDDYRRQVRMIVPLVF